VFKYGCCSYSSALFGAHPANQILSAKLRLGMEPHNVTPINVTHQIRTSRSVVVIIVGNSWTNSFRAHGPAWFLGAHATAL
jgi:hypothetical protein